MYAFDKHSTVRGWYYPFYSVHHDTIQHIKNGHYITRYTQVYSQSYKEDELGLCL